MRRPEPLPSDLPPVFRVSEARAMGVNPARLSRSDLRSPHRGLRTSRSLPVPASSLEIAAQYAPRLAGWQFFSHETALEAVGAPMPEWPYRPRLHVAAHRPSREPRIPGVVGHRLQARQSAVMMSRVGLPIETPVRAWRQVGSLWALDDLIAAADYLLSGERPLATSEQLRDEIEVMGDVRRGILRRALVEVRNGVRSPRETRLRLALTRGGLPEPEINWVLRDGIGDPVAELDLAYPRWRVCAEYDGRVHETDRRQFARDADRWDSIREQGWEHVRILNVHMQHGAVRAVERVRDALIRAGWHDGA
ncbi:conserved hypothetical protein [Microbacterium sp. C448]|nr:conserved hypothetical protein [Microbacterium sp. C448]